ncbi:MAG: hypothetical protein JXB48_15850 [Candidatus Latescibacteria bacterium]|nr:hypothetical protein [Candidatus Latescibacterota bacterium]
MNKKRVVLLISTDEYVRNYLLTAALSKVEMEYQCFFIASEKVTIRDPLQSKKNFLGFIALNQKLIKRNQRMFDVMMWRFRKKSSAFYFRFLRYLQIDLLKWNTDLPQYLKNISKFIIYNAKDQRWLYCILFGNRLVFPFYKKFRGANIPINGELYAKIKEISPDLLVFPSSAYDPIGNDLIRIGVSQGIKTLFLIDNWDNLSSKSLFWIRPDYLGVWGEQSKKHAREIHGFDDRKIFTLGTPRFDAYFTRRNTPLESSFDFRYILFTGCAIAFDEVSTLLTLEHSLESNKELCRGLKIVYRPHPWRQTRIYEPLFVEKQFTHIIIDPQVKEAYYSNTCTNSIGKNFQPSLEYYPSLLQNAVFVIGPLTTMLIEALLFYKKVIALAYDDGVHLTSPHNALKYYTHFEGIEKIEGMTICRDQKELEKYIVTFLHETKVVNKEKLDSDLHYYLFNDGIGYPKRLEKVLKQIAPAT